MTQPLRKLELGPVEPDLGDEIFGLSNAPDDCLVHLLPVPFDATTSFRPGTAEGPASVRRASPQIEWFDPAFGRTYRHGVHLHPVPRALARLSREARRAALPVMAVEGNIGDDRRLARAVDRVNRAGEAVNEHLAQKTRDQLDAGRLVGVLGGDHSVPFAAIREIARRHPGVGILHVDAHADLREAYEGFTWSHASIMYNVATRVPEVSRIVQVGIRDYCEEERDRIRSSAGRIRTWFDDALKQRLDRGSDFGAIATEIVSALPREVYVSFDIDGLDPELCPHTGTPVPGGLSFDQATALLKALALSGRRIVGFDLCEVAPGPRHQDWDGIVGSRVLYKLIGAAVLSNTAAHSVT